MDAVLRVMTWVREDGRVLVSGTLRARERPGRIFGQCSVLVRNLRFETRLTEPVPVHELSVVGLLIGGQVPSPVVASWSVQALNSALQGPTDLEEVRKGWGGNGVEQLRAQFQALAFLGIQLELESGEAWASFPGQKPWKRSKTVRDLLLQKPEGVLLLG